MAVKRNQHQNHATGVRKGRRDGKFESEMLRGDVRIDGRGKTVTAGTDALCLHYKIDAARCCILRWRCLMLDAVEREIDRRARNGSDP